MRFLFILLLLGGYQQSFSQGKPFQKKLPVIDKYIDSFMHAWNIPGLALCIVYKDQLIYAKGYGYRDLENKLPVDAQTIFPIASNTKLFTATAALLLQEEKKLNLDNPARDYMPALRFSTDNLNANVTLRDMLSHRTGLFNYGGLWAGASVTRKELTERVVIIPPALGLREGYIYNNMMYVAAGTVMETVTGKSWETIIREKLLTPLQMNATHFFGDGSKASGNIAFPYYAPDSSRTLKRRTQVIQTPALGPAGTMLSNLTDMSHWMIAQLNGGKYKGAQAFSASAIQQSMVPNAVADREGKWPELSHALYGLGRNVQTYKGHKIATHTGSIDGFYSNLTFFPSDSLAVFMVHNSIPGGSVRSVMAFPVFDRLLSLPPTDWSGRYLSEEIRELAMDEKERDSVAATQVLQTLPSKAIGLYAGKYHHPVYGDVVITIEKESLQFSFRNTQTQLHHFHYDQFVTREEMNSGRAEFRLNFLMNAKGDIDRFAMRVYGDPAVEFVKSNTQINAELPKHGDLGNGTYLNPILGGDYADPSIMRDGNDYYMTHSAFDYQPGLTVFHSTDLVNWKPISYALSTYLGTGWAPDICKYKDQFLIYFTIAGRGNFVVYAKSPHGPWSEPVDLKLSGIDPCHIVDETGQRWLFMNAGLRAKLSPDGLSVIPGSTEKVYDGWEFPREFESDGFNLEGPKLKKIGDYYYMVSAQGGTAGPPQSHMAIVARSKSINGPWENAPDNPLIHTYKDSEKWWAKGHGSLIDAPDGTWWIVYHAYENSYLGIGRQTLLEPIEITKDGWLKAPSGIAIEKPLHKPITSQKSYNTTTKLNAFQVGLDWKFYKKFDADRTSVKDGVLTLKAQGKTPQESAPMLFVTAAHNYEMSVKIDSDSLAVAGLILFYNADYFVGTGFDKNTRYRWRKGSVRGTWPHLGGNHLWLKIRNVNHIVTGYYSYDGIHWEKEIWGMDISGYHHNTLYDFVSVLPGLFAYGEGDVQFSEFTFTVLDK